MRLTGFCSQLHSNLKRAISAWASNDEGLIAINGVTARKSVSDVLLNNVIVPNQKA